MRTADYLDALKARLGLPSDYALAQRLGVHRAVLSNYRNGKRCFDAPTAALVAELLELDPLKVLADMEHERATEPGARRVWGQIAARFKDAAIVAAIGIGTACFGGLNNNAFASASGPVNAEPNTHCARNKRRRWLDALGGER